MGKLFQEITCSLHKIYRILSPPEDFVNGKDKTNMTQSIWAQSLGDLN